MQKTFSCNRTLQEWLSFYSAYYKHTKNMSLQQNFTRVSMSFSAHVYVARLYVSVWLSVSVCACQIPNLTLDLLFFLFPPPQFLTKKSGTQWAVRTLPVHVITDVTWVTSVYIVPFCCFCSALFLSFCTGNFFSSRPFTTFCYPFF